MKSGDETGIDIAGVLHWLWVWQTETASFFKAYAKRGHKAIEDTFDKGLPDTVLVCTGITYSLISSAALRNSRFKTLCFGMQAT